MTDDNQTRTMGTTAISALFDSQSEAQRAVDRLIVAGIASDRIRQVVGGAETAVTDTREKGFWESLGDFFFPDEDRYTYAEGLARGGYLVTVTGLAGAEYDTALDILDDEGSIDLDERSASWRSEGWGGYEGRDHAADVAAPSGIEATGDYDERRALVGDDALPMAQDSLRVGRRETGHGRSRVRAYTLDEG